jgi:DNA-binding CsgD family transcriptional regulator
MQINDASKPHELLGLGLSKREHEVIAITARGLSNRQVATELGISIHAVKFHLASIYRKLDVRNRTEAAVRFYAAGSVQERPLSG